MIKQNSRYTLDPVIIFMRRILLPAATSSTSSHLVSLAAVVLVIIGAYVGVRDARRLSPCPEGADFTTDIYLWHLGVSAPTETIRRSLASLPDVRSCLSSGVTNRRL